MKSFTSSFSVNARSLLQAVAPAGSAAKFSPSHSSHCTPPLLQPLSEAHHHRQQLDSISSSLAQYISSGFSALLLTHLKQFVHRLELHPEVSSLAWEGDIVPQLMSVRRTTRDIEVIHQVNLALALLGHAPEYHKGLRILSIDGGGIR